MRLGVYSRCNVVYIFEPHGCLVQVCSQMAKLSTSCEESTPRPTTNKRSAEKKENLDPHGSKGVGGRFKKETADQAASDNDKHKKKQTTSESRKAKEAQKLTIFDTQVKIRFCEFGISSYF